MIARQRGLFGDSVVGGDVPHVVQHVLEGNEAARDDYMETTADVWFMRDGLDDLIPVEFHEVLHQFISTKATSPKTIVNWQRRIQRQHPELAASPRVQEIRQRQATQGPVRCPPLTAANASCC